MFLRAILVVLMAIYFTPDAKSDSLRCGSDLVVVSQSSVVLLAKCGEPYLREPLVRDEEDHHGNHYRNAYGERWTYNFGPSTFLKKVIIENGEITAIELGDRGF